MTKNVCIIDRSDLDEIVSYNPDTKRRMTRLEDLQETPSRYHRRDIVLINCTRYDKQYILEVTKTGFSGDLWILDILSDREHDEVISIANRMRRNASKHPVAAALITGGM
jgi:hypothetical protein